jgi:CRISPR type IV-associated protein Csf3
MQTGKIATTELYLPLDSILAWAWIKENYPERLNISASAIHPDKLIDPILPLERRGEGDNWYWACSFACGDSKNEEILYWHKRFDAQLAEEYVDFGKRRGKVDVKAGNYKNYRMPLITYLIPKLEWYAIGDCAEIERMLNQVFFIGKKRDVGFGRVSKWTAEEWPEDLSFLRPIPDEKGDQEMGIRPPYWMASQYKLVKFSEDGRLACNNGQLAR